MKRPSGLVFSPPEKSKDFPAKMRKGPCAPLTCTGQGGLRGVRRAYGVLTGRGPPCRGPETALTCKPRTITAIASSRLMVGVLRP